MKNLLLQERERLFNLLNQVPFLKPFSSHSNFILCEVTSEKDAKKLKVSSLPFLTLTVIDLEEQEFRRVYTIVSQFNLKRVIHNPTVEL